MNGWGITPERQTALEGAVLGCRGQPPAQIRTGRSEDAFAHEDQVVRTDRIVKLGLEHLDVAVAHTAVQTDATVGTTQGQTTALAHGLGH